MNTTTRFAVIILLSAALCPGVNAQDYTFLFDEDTGFLLSKQNWSCNIGNPPNFNRCYWTTPHANPPAGWPNTCPNSGSSGTTDTRVILNGLKAAQSNNGWVYYTVQGNADMSGIGRCPSYDAAGNCSTPEGPFGIQNGLGGDEYYLFRCPYTDPICPAPQLIQDRMRPNNLDCDPSQNPFTCEQWSWQMKELLYNVTKSQFSLFVKVQGIGFDTPEQVMTPAHLVLLRATDQNIANTHTAWNKNGTGNIYNYNTIFWIQSDDRWCDGTFGFTSPTCATPTNQRFTDVGVVSVPVTRTLPLVTGMNPAANPTCSVSGSNVTCSTEYQGIAVVVDEYLSTNSKWQTSFFTIVDKVGIWFATYNQTTKLRTGWQGVAWGKQATFKLPKHPGFGANSRTADLSVARVSAGGGKPNTLVFWQQRATTDPPAPIPCLADHPQATQIFTCNYPTPSTFEFYYDEMDLDGVIKNASKSDSKTSTHQINWPHTLPTRYANGIVDWAYDYFEVATSTYPYYERYLAYGTMDNLACSQYLKKLVASSSTGRGIRTFRLIESSEQ